MKLKLRNKFLLPTITLIIIGMGISTVVSYFASKNAIENMAVAQIDQLADSTVTQIASWIRDIKLDLSNWSEGLTFKTAIQDTFMGESVRDTASVQLADITKNYEIFEYLVLANIMGESLASSDSDILETLNVSEQTFFQEVLKDEVVISKVLISEFTATPVFMVAAPIKQSDDTVGGVLFGAVSMEYFNSAFIEPITMGEAGYAYVYNTDGLIIAHQNKDYMMNLNLKDLDFGRDMMERGSGSITYTFEGREEMSAFKNTKETGWTVAVVADRAVLLAPAKRIGYTNLSLAFAIVILVGGVIFLIAQSIIRPVSKIVSIASDMANGDLDKDIDIRQQDEIGDLADAFRNMKAKIRDVVVNVKTAADNVASGSQAMSSSSAQMSQGATAQAASAEEVSASMEEMVANIRQNADNALQTEQIAVKASEDARESRQAVAEAVTAMQEIAKKVAIIEDITRQTRMLSLNATIEAARAQEHGKGFAVVASEVRGLAERSQTAATEINQLAGSSVAVAEKAGEMLMKLVPDIQKTAELVQEISASSKEQRTGSDQINQAIQQLDHVTQQNSAISEEMASTAEELASQAEMLQHAITFFKTEETEKTGQTEPAPEFRANAAHITDHKSVATPKTASDGKTEGHALHFRKNSGTEDEQDSEFERY